jgi:hypothetical protein
MNGLFLAALLLAQVPGLPPDDLPTDLPESGRFGSGVGLELLGLGATQGATRFGYAGGLSLYTAVQFDMGPQWAFRLPISLDFTARAGNAAYGALAFTPGMVHRWRSTVDQRWIPYVGLGVRLASQAVRRDFVGLPALPAASAPLVANLDLGEHHFGGGNADDPNLEARLSIGPEVWVGYELHTNRWSAFNFGLTYAFSNVDGVIVHVVRETVGVRLTL